MIRFMGEVTVDVPLWDDDGLMFNTPEDLARAFDLSDDLVAEIVTWAREWQTNSGEPDHDAEAARLVRRIKRELNDEVGLVYQP
jgi:hypothetical protein